MPKVHQVVKDPHFKVAIALHFGIILVSILKAASG